MVDWSEVPKDKRHARSQSTRESILFAAERMFAEHGIDSVSLRDIGLAAGQKNNGAVQYHFGDRDNLVLQIVAYREQSTEDVRAKLLKEIRESASTPTVRDHVRAFVMSLATLLDQDNYFLRFFSRLYVERGRSPHVPLPPGDYEALRDTMLQLLPHLDPAILTHRWRLMTITTIHALAGYQAALKTRTMKTPSASLTAELIDFLTAGLEGPVSQEARRNAADNATDRAQWGDWP
jgi:AcrR family transcriptional regulator